MTIKCFGYTFDQNIIEKVEYNDKTSTLKEITRKDYPNPLKYVINVVPNANNNNATLTEIAPGQYTLTKKDSTNHLSSDDIILFTSGDNPVKFRNECKIHIQNYKVPEYKELYEIAKKCTEDANFPSAWRRLFDI